MARKTAHISLLVEYDDEDLAYVNPQTVNVNTNGSGWPSARLDVTGCTIIGTPRVEHHDRAICGISYAEMSYVTAQMIQQGGHIALGQGVVPGPVIALTRRIGECLRQSLLVDTAYETTAGYRLDRAVG